MTLLAVNFHYVRPTYDAPHAGIHGVTPDAFEAQLKALSRVGRFVSAREVKDAVQGRGTLPERAILITFDDGLREQYDYALPILDRMGVPALFFINSACIDGEHLSCVHQIHLLRAYAPPARLWEALLTAAEEDGVPLSDIDVSEAEACRQYLYDTPEDARLKYLLNIALDAKDVERWVARIFVRFDRDPVREARALYMAEDQIRALGEREALGSHSHHHRALARLGESELAYEVEQSFTRLRALAPGAEVSAFSFPYGGKKACTERAIPHLERCGAVFGLSTERAVNEGLESAFFLARFASNDVPGGTKPLFQPETFFEAAPRRTWFLESGAQQ